MALAHNTYTSGYLIPVIIEDDNFFPFEPGERESEWHEATEAEIAAYDAYWDSRD